MTNFAGGGGIITLGGYNIYEKTADGSLNYLGRTDSTSFTVNATSANSTYVIKSAYSLFTKNMSDGLIIKTNSNIDSNVEDIINPKPSDDNDNNNNDNELE